MSLEALTFYRIGRKLQRAHVPLLPRVCETLTFLIFNSNIPLRAEIGHGSRAAHRGIAIVIHARARIGERCIIRPQVVIGGTGTGTVRKAAPIIGDDVELGVGAKILGPITIGDRAVIGANAVVIRDVPPDTVVAGVPARVIRTTSDGLSTPPTDQPAGMDADPSLP